MGRPSLRRGVGVPGLIQAVEGDRPPPHRLGTAQQPPPPPALPNNLHSLQVPPCPAPSRLLPSHPILPPPPPPPRPCPPLVPPTVGGASAGEAASRASLPNVRWWPGWQRSAPSSEIARLSLKGRRSSRPSARLGRRRPQVPPQERRCGFFALLPPTTTTATSSPPPLRPASPRFPRRLSPSLPTLLLLLPSASFPAHPPTRPPPGSVRESRAHAPRAGQGGGRRVSAS